MSGISLQDIINIEMIGYTDEVQMKCIDLRLAIKSTFASQMQSQYKMKFFAADLPVDLTAVESDETRHLFRYQMQVKANYAYTKEQAIEYFEGLKVEGYSFTTSNPKPIQPPLLYLISTPSTFNSASGNTSPDRKSVV